MKGHSRHDNGGQEQLHTDDNGVERKYQHKLTYSGATYTITTAVFTADIEDVVTNYTGDDYEFNIEGGTTDAPGHTLAATPTFFDVALNDLAFVDGEGNSSAPAAGRAGADDDHRRRRRGQRPAAGALPQPGAPG